MFLAIAGAPIFFRTELLQNQTSLQINILENRISLKIRLFPDSGCIAAGPARA